MFAVKGKGKGGFLKGVWNEWTQKLTDAGREEKVDPKGWCKGEMVKPWSHVGQFLVSFQLARQSVGS